MKLQPWWMLSVVLAAPMLARAAPPITCVDYRGIEVREVPDYFLRDAAVANVLPNGEPVILYQPLLSGVVSDQTKWFIFAHECAHHVLGHTTEQVRAGNEQEADCWAISTLYKRGILDDRGVKIVQNELAATGRADATHLSGVERAVNLDRCLVAVRREELIHTAER